MAQRHNGVRNLVTSFYADAEQSALEIRTSFVFFFFLREISEFLSLCDAYQAKISHAIRSFFTFE